MNDSTLNMLAIYYFVFWLINVTAYIIATLGFRRWLEYLEDTSLYRICKNSSYITGAVALVRFISGTIGVMLLLTSRVELITFIFILGVFSLFLNTGFILIEAIFINQEARRASRLDVVDAELLERTIRQMDNLRLTVERRARLPKLDGRTN